MAYRYGLKINKTELPDKTPYTEYYPHITDRSLRKWSDDYYQIVSIDPGQTNYAFRLEKRFASGRIICLGYEKIRVKGETDDETLIATVYDNVTRFLDTYLDQYCNTHIAQHTLSYFMIKCKDMPLLPMILEVDPKLKGKMLGSPKGINDKQLKTWAVQIARQLLEMREDTYSLGVMNKNKRKQDDLADTVCMIEALFAYWGLPLTSVTPPTITLLCGKGGESSSSDKVIDISSLNKKPKLSLVLPENTGKAPVNELQVDESYIKKAGKINMKDFLQNAPKKTMLS